MIRLASNVAVVLIRYKSPCNSGSNVVNFFDSSNKSNWKLSSIFCQYVSNISASQIKDALVLVVLNERPLL